MRQIVLRTPGEFVKREVSVPVLSPGEALVRIRKVGVCYMHKAYVENDFTERQVCVIGEFLQAPV